MSKILPILSQTKRYMGNAHNLLRGVSLAMAFGAIGFFTLQASHAATFAIAKEAESGTPTGNYDAGDVNGASSSASVKFGTTATPPPPPPSAKPNASTAGIPAGTTLSNWTGGTSGFDSSSNQTYQNITLPVPSAGYWTFAGSHLTFRNCKINGGVVLSRGTDITVDHCDIPGGISISGNTVVRLTYNNIHEFDDGIHITSDTGPVSNVTIRNNYVHNPTPGCGAHADGMQLLGVNSLIVEDNNIDMGPRIFVCGQDVLNSVFQIENTQGPNSNLTINHNWINGGGITARFYSCSNSTFTNNRFGRDYYYGATTVGDPSCLTNKSGNVFDDNNQPIVVQ